MMGDCDLAKPNHTHCRRWHLRPYPSDRGNQGDVRNPCSIDLTQEIPVMSRVTEIRYVGYATPDYDAEFQFHAFKWSLDYVPSDNTIAYLKVKSTSRAVKYKPRFASGARWSADHNEAEVQRKRVLRKSGVEHASTNNMAVG